MPDLAPDKTVLRRQLRARRRLLPAHWQAWASRQVAGRLLRWVAAFKCRHIALFWPLPGEVVLISAMRALSGQGRRVYLPRRIASPAALTFVAWRPGSDLKRGPNGLWQPCGPAICAAQLEAVIMPGLAFDRAGTRLGQGGGAYDRALTRSRAQRVGVAWDDFVLPSAALALPRRSLPRAAHDLPVDWLLTPRMTLACPAARLAAHGASP